MKKTAADHAFQDLVTSTNIFFFLAGFVLLTIFGSSLYDILILGLDKTIFRKYLPSSGSACLLSIASFIALWHLRYRKILKKLSNQPWELKDPIRPAKKKGLILFLSNEPCAQHAIEYHKSTLKHIWMFYSPETETIRTSLQNKYPSIKIESICLKNLEELFLLDTVYDRLRGLFSKLPEGFKKEDVIIDTTGMTKPVTMGAFLAGQQYGYPLQYVQAKYNPELKAVQPADILEIVFTLK